MWNGSRAHICRRENSTRFGFGGLSSSWQLAFMIGMFVAPLVYGACIVLYMDE